MTTTFTKLNKRATVRTPLPFFILSKLIKSDVVFISKCSTHLALNPACHGILHWKKNNLLQFGHFDFVATSPHSSKIKAEQLCQPKTEYLHNFLDYLSNRSESQIFQQPIGSKSWLQFGNGQGIFTTLSTSLTEMYVVIQSMQNR